MILWLILFILVVVISFILAARSMKDFTEIPTETEDYSLFLIRKTDQLNGKLFSSLRSDLLRSGSFISFEKLFKGKKSALVIFGSRKLLIGYKDTLDLLELEDYTNVNVEQISAWEVEVKNNGQGLTDEGQRLFSGLPHFSETDHFWWQVILPASFKPQVRAIFVSPNADSRTKLTHILQNLNPHRIPKLPKAFSNKQILDFYQKRSYRKDNKNPVISSEYILQLIF